MIESTYKCKGNLGSKSDCVLKTCGDGNLDTGEDCDNDAVPEANFPASGDGCSSLCKVESGYSCFGSLGQSSVCKPPLCGDGLLNSDEECDNDIVPSDQFPLAGDGCSQLCKIEPTFKC